MRDVEPVVSAEREEEVVARHAGDLLRLEAEELSDAVILVHDVVADTKIGERRERTTEPRVRTWRPLAEDLRVGEEDEAKIAPDEAAPRRRDREAHRRLPGSAAPSGRIVLSTFFSRPPCRSASPRCGNVTTTRLSGADEACELVLGLREAARCDRGPLRFELERLAAREWIELRRTLERDRLEAFLLPDAPSPRRAARRSPARDRRVRRDPWKPVRRSPHAPTSPRGGPQLSISTVSPRRSAAGYMLAAATGCSARCVNGEKARTCSISSPKNSTRSGSRPVEGKTSTMPPRTANWPRSIDSVDALVPGARERLATARRDRAPPPRRGRRAGVEPQRRHPLGQRGRRGTHEAAAGEDIEGARPLADEVGWRLETRSVRDAPTREQSDAIRAEEPRGSFGGVAGVRVLGQEDEEAASELLVERGENERKRRLRHARATGQRLRECLEPIAAGELRDEGVKGCLVHANSGKRAPRAYPSAPLLEVVATQVDVAAPGSDVAAGVPPRDAARYAAPVRRSYAPPPTSPRGHSRAPEDRVPRDVRPVRVAIRTTRADAAIAAPPCEPYGTRPAWTARHRMSGRVASNAGQEPVHGAREHPRRPPAPAYAGKR